MAIEKVHARQIFDSRGNPTVEAPQLRMLRIFKGHLWRIKKVIF